jgi:hypothetical protein
MVLSGLALAWNIKQIETMFSAQESSNLLFLSPLGSLIGEFNFHPYALENQPIGPIGQA